MNNRNRGKNTGDDVLFGTEKQLEKLRAAVSDMHYLLSRGYPEKTSSELVGNRYRLKSRQIQALRGASASELQLKERQTKQVAVQDLENKAVFLDGFNVLILLESLLSEAYIFEGLDGCFRDLSGVHGTYKRVNQTLKSVELIASFYKKSGISKLVWVFDQPVSNSGRMKQMVADFASEQHLDWEAELQFNPDQFIAEHAEIAVSSDAWILDHCKSWFNLVRYLIHEEELSVNSVRIIHDEPF
ncbi:MULTISPECIES: DUF434 domain-containing protein [Chryseobacterium]|uniref:DUF434 domain-containing protein n=1 Tax=Chryseobacterium camelliae TaxID=1265445 RepID=A0ABU0TD28_9FLAO|nr:MULTISPECIES: DUF434 domain-containing protein [Chryseobacterium]MDT3407231.1 hypothetical protein [Pseudacidovorax intermedius]MDQ1094979.1 hypothetical protein [Chryseobacterium camelliae]MDQ1098919.1 hypothetical protein [Chryseobacterium sp. SORGH_AS_1048]MDR6086267.1 hypothetical protein [Chryseobacterium sp. SORGH_AS_0909]MDR6130638.1 hypothetical protein [Chryseobacterium sp. SORGH_AS_1175]